MIIPTQNYIKCYENILDPEVCKKIVEEDSHDFKSATTGDGTVNKHRVEFTIGRDFNLKNRSTPQNFFVYPIVRGTNYTKSFSYKNL